MKLAHHVFLGTNQDGTAQVGSPNNSRTASGGFSKTNFQFGGNMLTGSGENHQSLTTPKDRKQHPVFTARPTQQKLGATGYTGATGQFITPNNIPRRSVAGSPQSRVSARTQTGANTVKMQNSSRAVARGIQGVNTTTRRGGSSNLHLLKPVAGTTSTYQLPSPSSGGRGSVELTTVTSVHYVGLHRIVVSKRAQTKSTFTRPVGQV